MKKSYLGGIIVALLILNMGIVLGDVFINEIMYNPASFQAGGDSNAEWVELYNNGASVVDLTGWKINDDTFDPINISPGEYIIIAEKLDGVGNTFESYWGNNDTVWDVLDGFNATDSSTFSFDDNSGIINLTNSSGDLINQLAYDDAWGADDNGKTLERYNFISNNLGESQNVNGTPGAENSIYDNTDPVADFTITPLSVDEGQNVLLNASISTDVGSGIKNYTWDFGNGDPIEYGETVNHVYGQNGTYTITLTVYDEAGFNNATSKLIIVNDLGPIANATFISGSKLDGYVVGEGVVLTVSASNSFSSPDAIVSYYWEFGDGKNNSGRTPGHTYCENKTMDGNLTVVDSDGSPDIDFFSITVTDANPTPEAGDDQEVAEDVLVTFNASQSTVVFSPCDDILNWSWDFGDGSPIEYGEVVTHAYDENDTYIATLTVYDEDSFAQDTLRVNVSYVNDAPVITGVPNQIASEDVNLTLNVTSYISDVDNATSELTITENSTYATVNGQVITFNYPNGVLGEDVKITVSDGSLTNEQNITVTVTAVNDAPTIVGVPNPIATEDVNLTLNVTPYLGDVDNAVSSLIITEDSAYATVNGQVITFNYPNGILEENVTLTVSDGTLTNEQNITVTVTPVNDAPIVSAIASLSFLEGSSVLVNLNDYVSDIDNTKDQINWISGPSNVNVNIDNTGKIMNVSTTTWYGNDVFELIANDGGKTDSVNVSVDVQSILSFSNLVITIDGTSYAAENGSIVGPAGPDSIVSVSVDITNNYPGLSQFVENLILTGKINSQINYVETTGTPFVLNGATTVTKTLIFDELPLTINEGEYSFKLNAIGTDKYGVSRVIELSAFIDYVTMNNEVRIVNEKIDLGELRCIREPTLTFDVVNTGETTQYVTIAVSNAELGIDNNSPNVLMIAKSVNPFTHNYVFDETVEAGTYPVTISITYDDGNGGYETKTEIVDLIIDECFDVPDFEVLEDSTDTVMGPYYMTNYVLLVDLYDYLDNITKYYYSNYNIHIYVVNITNDGSINCIRSDPTIDPNEINCYPPTANETGYSEIIAKVMIYETTPYRNIYNYTDTFRVIVTPVNDPVSLLAIPDINFTEGHSHQFDLSAYISDIDTALADMNFTFEGVDNFTIVRDHDAVFEISTVDPDWNGRVEITITVNDEDSSDSRDVFVDVLNDFEEKPEITSRDPEENNLLIGDGDHQKLKITVSNPDNITYVVNWYVNGDLNETDTLQLDGKYQFDFESAEDDIDVEVRLENLAGTEVYDEFDWEYLVSLVPVTDYEGTIGDVEESNVKNFTGLTIYNSNINIDFGNQTIDLSDVVDVDPNVMLAKGVVGIDTHALDVFETTPATITMYGLTSASTPAIYYNSGFTTTGTDVCNAGTDPACTNVVYDATTGTLVFDVSHFTVFFLNNPPVITSSAKTTAIVNEAYSYQVTATDAENDSLTYLLTTKPSGMNISATGLISWTPLNITKENVTVSVSDGTNTITQPFNIDVTEGPKLVISDLDVKIGGESAKNLQDGEKIPEDARPGDIVKFDIELENLFSTDTEIQDIEVIVTIENIDDSDDLEEEETMDDIKDGDQDSVTLEFTIPTLVEDGEYNVIIEVNAEDEYGHDQDIRWELTLNVKKDKHDLIIDNAELSPLTVGCSRNPSLDIEVINIGQEDEDDVTIKIESYELDLNIEEDIELEEGDTDDSVFEKTYRLQIDDDVMPGVYPITVTAYYDGKKSDEETVDLTVEKCIDTIMPLEKELVQVITTTDKAVKPAEPSVTKISFKDSSEYITLLAIVFILLLGGAVFLVGAVVILMKK